MRRTATAARRATATTRTIAATSTTGMIATTTAGMTATTTAAYSPGRIALPRLEAIAAEDRTSRRRNERHHGIGAAPGAHRRMQLFAISAIAPISAVATISPVAARREAFGTAAAGTITTAALALAGVAATLAAVGSMGQSVLSIEGLLTRREEKLLSTIHALEALIFTRFHDFEHDLPECRDAPAWMGNKNASTAKADEAIEAIPAK